ncbi:MAG: acyltransferase [Oscillospiraceae bacterium]|nr:acyltransferase [Oscillospiraceae bacterium]
MARKDGKYTLYFDLIRITAILFVLYNHSSTMGFELYTLTDNPYTFPLYIVMATICKAGVPLFLMVSGALLLGKEESVKDLYTRRVSRMVIALILFSFVMHVKTYGFSEFGLFFQNLLGNNVSPAPFWYLYSYLGYLIMLPFLRSLVKNAGNHVTYLLAVCTAFMLMLPALRYICGINIAGEFDVPMTAQFIIYPVIGYMLSKLELNWKQLTGAAVMTVISVGAAYLLLTKTLAYDPRTQFGLSEFIFWISVFLFMVLKKLGNMLNPEGVFGRICALVGACTFGIYLLEPFMIRSLMYRVAYIFVPYIPSVLAVCVGCVAAVCVGTGVVWVMRKIPVINKLL